MDKKLSPILQQLSEAMAQRELSLAAVARLTKIPYDRMYKWYKDGTKPKEADATILREWIEKNLITDKKEKDPEDGSFRDKYYKGLEDNNEFLKRMMDVNLTALATGQKMIIAQVKTVLQYKAQEVAKGIPQKVEAEMMKINTMIASNLNPAISEGN